LNGWRILNYPPVHFSVKNDQRYNLSHEHVNVFCIELDSIAICVGRAWKTRWSTTRDNDPSSVVILSFRHIANHPGHMLYFPAKIITKPPVGLSEHILAEESKREWKG
jgi:hypothetical protein